MPQAPTPRHVPGTSEIEPDALLAEEPELVFFRACRLGPAYSFVLRHYSGELRSRQMVWPDWLPYAHPRDVAPMVAGVHIHWPGRGEGAKVAPDQRVAVMTYKGRDVVPVRKLLLRAGWIDMSERWASACVGRREVLARPPEVPVAVVEPAAVAEVVTRARARRTSTSAAPDPGAHKAA